MTEAPSERAHARLAPSAAHRWAKCPGSVVLEAALPDSSSEAAEHGTAAHELAAWALTTGKDPSAMAGRVIDVNGTGHATIFLKEDAPMTAGRYRVDDEMVEHITDFVRIVRGYRGSQDDLRVEKRVYATQIHAEDCHGTADVIIHSPDEKTLRVMDLKYGRGVVVEAEENAQGVCYMAGAMNLFGNYEIDTVEFHIYQPRATHPDGPHRIWSITPDDLKRHVKDLADAAIEVDEATGGAAAVDWNEEFLTAGDHCRFCKAGATCPAREQQALDLAKTEFGVVPDLEAPQKMSPERLGEVLTTARQIQHWIKAVEKYAHEQAASGNPPAGFKLVGGRATRYWKDEEKLVKLLPVLTSVTSKDMYEDPKLRSVAQMEKVLSKDEKAALQAHIGTRRGTLLVPEDDKRPAVTPDAAEEFDNVELS